METDYNFIKSEEAKQIYYIAIIVCKFLKNFMITCVEMNKA